MKRKPSPPPRIRRQSHSGEECDWGCRQYCPAARMSYSPWTYLTQFSAV